jgi:hypothetical protein
MQATWLLVASVLTGLLVKHNCSNRLFAIPRHTSLFAAQIVAMTGLLVFGLVCPVQAVSLADLIQSNGAIIVGDTRFDHFRGSISTFPTVLPPACCQASGLSQVELQGTQLDGNPGLRITGLFVSADIRDDRPDLAFASNPTIQLSLEYDVIAMNSSAQIHGMQFSGSTAGSGNIDWSLTAFDTGEHVIGTLPGFLGIPPRTAETDLTSPVGTLHVRERIVGLPVGFCGHPPTGGGGCFYRTDVSADTAFSQTAIPEPSSLLLFGTGFMVIAYAVRSSFGRSVSTFQGPEAGAIPKHVRSSTP